MNVLVSENWQNNLGENIIWKGEQCWVSFKREPWEIPYFSSNSTESLFYFLAAEVVKSPDSFKRGSQFCLYISQNLKSLFYLCYNFLNKNLQKLA